MPLRHSHARFRMVPACARMTRKRRKRQADKRRFGRELSALLSPESLPHDRHEQRQISYYYRAILTITVILANAGTHSSASAECFVSKSPHSGKHLQTKRQHSPSPSFSRTREPIQPRPPRVSLAKVLTATSIYKRRDNAPQMPSFSRTREPIQPRPQRVSLAKVLTATSIYKRRDNVPPSPSFSRTREPIHLRTPSASLAKVLTAASIYKRRDSVPQCRHSRERGNPFIRVRREFR